MSPWLPPTMNCNYYVVNDNLMKFKIHSYIEGEKSNLLKKTSLKFLSPYLFKEMIEIFVLKVGLVVA